MNSKKRDIRREKVFFFYINKNFITIFDEERKKFEEELSKQSKSLIKLDKLGFFYYNFVSVQARNKFFTM
jgi:hypothetical protein